MNFNDKQLKIFDEWENSNSNILIQACAGSGKTTTLLNLLEKCKYKTLYLAFNKSIQKEVQEKINQKGLKQGLAMTIHSLGNLAIKQNYPKAYLDNQKIWNILKELESKNKKFFTLKKGSCFKRYSQIMQLKFILKDMNDISRLYIEEDFHSLLEIMDNMDKSVTLEINQEDLKNLFYQMLHIRNKIDNATNKDSLPYDFIDMIYLPVYKSMFIPIDPYYLFIDECQDLNICQHLFIDKLLEQGSVKRWVACGDKYQSIYGFSGAYSSSFDLFKYKQKENTIQLPLDINYRCATSIIEKSNEVYNIITPFRKDKGIVNKYLINSTFFNDIKNQKNVMIICRNTKPLVDLYFNLIHNKVNATLWGKDIENSLFSLLKPYKSTTLYEVKNILKEKQDKLSQEENKKDYFILTDKINLLEICMRNFDMKIHNTCDELLSKFSNIVKENIKDKDSVILCTIHKSKGLEANIVYFLEPSLIPSPFARSRDQKEQEKNLKYVGITRAKNELYFLENEKQ